MQNINTIGNKKKNGITTLTLVRIGILSALAFVIMLFKFPMPFVPPFLTMDFSEIPVVIATFSMGIYGGILVELIKNLLHFFIKSSETAGLGELANFLVGALYVIPLGLIYHRKKSISGVVIGSVAATLTMTIGASLINYFFLIPVYVKAFNLQIDKLVETTTAVNQLVSSFPTLIAFGIAPFNLFKGIVVSILGYLLFKALRPILK